MDADEVRYRILLAINDVQQKNGSGSNVELGQIEAVTGLDTQTIEDELDLLDQEGCLDAARYHGGIDVQLNARGRRLLQALSAEQARLLRERSEWEQAETLLLMALTDERAYLDDFETSRDAWGTAGQMRQLAGKTYFVDGEIPRGGGSVSVVVTGDPHGHRNDVLYLGARVGQRDICIYVRDVVQRASASMTPGLVWAVTSPGVRPDEPSSWHMVSSSLELFDAIRSGMVSPRTAVVAPPTQPLPPLPEKPADRAAAQRQTVYHISTGGAPVIFGNTFEKSPLISGGTIGDLTIGGENTPDSTEAL